MAEVSMESSEHDRLVALTPLDGRYAKQTTALRKYFSEFALFKYRVHVEVEYFAALVASGHIPQLSAVPPSAIAVLRERAANFSLADAAAVKAKEAVTRHDVKAVELFLREVLTPALPPEQHGAVEFIHFALTSNDVNNTAVPLALRDATLLAVCPAVDAVVARLRTGAHAWADTAMLARTHGQPATPTTLGKEFAVFVERLERAAAPLRTHRWSAKFGGAVGGFNAHVAAYPAVAWRPFADAFVASLGLVRQGATTQIEHYDDVAALCHCLCRVATVCVDLARDCWDYISRGYFRLAVVAGEVGSSTMPHKVNPIDFENAEGNFGVATALLGHIAGKLPISRLQRDLTDSTVLRALGSAFGHVAVAFDSLARGLGKLAPDAAAIGADLDAHWELLAEPIQTILRREGATAPYDTLKALTQGVDSSAARAALEKFVAGVAVSDTVRDELRALRPGSYVGECAAIARSV